MYVFFRKMPYSLGMAEKDKFWQADSDDDYLSDETRNTVAILAMI